MNSGASRRRKPHRKLAVLTTLLSLLIALGTSAMVPTIAHADGCGVLAPGASAAAERAVLAACKMVGKPYTWGGGHNGLPAPSQGHVDLLDPDSIHDGSIWSFDCSGFTRWAWFVATGKDVLTRGTAANQHDLAAAAAGSQVFTKAQGTGPLVPGDLLYFKNVRGIHHTSIYLGAGKVVEALESGSNIRVADFRPDEYFEAVRLKADQPDPPFRYPGEGKIFHTWGKGNYRTGHDTQSSIVYTDDGGSNDVRILCQADGEQATVSGITNKVWAYLPDYELWVSNIFIQGPAILPGVPPCSQYIAIGGDFSTPGGTDKAFSTWGTNVRVKSEPNTGSGTVHNFEGPTPIQVGCQKHAQLVTSDGYTNDAWSYLPEYGGWMTNIYIQGKAWLDGVPDCGGGSGGGAATCADNTNPSGSSARSPRVATLFGRTIELRYSDASQCAWGRISNGTIGDEIWVDRSHDGGDNWEPRLGLTSISSGTNVFTSQWRDAGVLMRACGRAHDRMDIVCTGWF